MKIAVLGYVGSGKTYVSNYISEIESIPCLHLDSIKYDKQWIPIDKSVALSHVAEFITKEDWVIDGLHRDLLLNERLEKADKIVMLLLPRLTCLFRAIKRKKERNREGYKNDTNWWFVKFTLFGCRNRERRRIYAQIAEKYNEKTIVLKTRRQVNAFMKLAEQTSK